MSRVTVLMPVYNGEPYLRKAVDSVLGQTLEDIQLICIDDASTDSSPEILSWYAALDSRVLVITHNVNTGQAIARNDGIRMADGDFITMVDADDWLSPDALELAVAGFEADNRTDTVLLELRYVRDGVEEPYPLRSGKREWSGAEAMELSLDWSLHGLYVAKRELFVRYPYDTTCRLYSDDNTTRLHYLHSDRVTVCNGIYYYRQYAQSMTNAISPCRYDLLEANTSMARMLCEENIPAAVRSRFERERWINLTGICIYWMTYDEQSETVDRNNAILHRLEAVYDDVDRSLLPLSLKLKLGYRPCGSFSRYLSEVRRYDKMRKLLKRCR